MPAAKVGIREFRENLATYLESKDPVAITRHGTTIGIFIPTRPRPTAEQLEAFRVASEKMQQMLNAAGINEEELMEDFERLRKEARSRKVPA